MLLADSWHTVGVLMAAFLSEMRMGGPTAAAPDLFSVWNVVNLCKAAAHYLLKVTNSSFVLAARANCRAKCKASYNIVVLLAELIAKFKVAVQASVTIPLGNNTSFLVRWLVILMKDISGQPAAYSMRCRWTISNITYTISAIKGSPYS